MAKMKNDVQKTLFRFNHPEMFDEDSEGHDEDGDDEDKEGSSLDDTDESQYGLAGGLPMLGPDAGIAKFEEEKKARAEDEQRRKSRAAAGLKELPKLATYDPISRQSLLMTQPKRVSGENFNADTQFSTTQMNSDGDSLAWGGSDGVFELPSEEIVPTLKTDISVVKREINLGYKVDQFLTVCRKFKKGVCTKTTCPRAHPGIRDNAELVPIEGKGKRGAFMVQVCWDWCVKGNCYDGMNCNKYHCYIRPSTQEIIAKMYPKRNGLRQKEAKSGMLTSGTVENEIFRGYCIIEWTNGDVYSGEVKNNYRDGWGIWRSADGTKEYLGNWERGQRSGWGILTHPIGESYTGEFKHGKMSGCGELTSSNGDVYQGNFENGKYQGVGRFQKSNGDTFVGYSENGMAEGLGSQVYANGFKYKGYFKKNKRR
jgi:hypothetical protein